MKCAVRQAKFMLLVYSYDPDGTLHIKRFLEERRHVARNQPLTIEIIYDHKLYQIIEQNGFCTISVFSRKDSGTMRVQTESFINFF